MNQRLNYAKMKITLTSPKLHENILKNSRLNVFKEIAIGFNHGIQMISESPVGLSVGFLVSIGKCRCYPCLQFIFGFAWSFVDLSLHRAPHIAIKGIAILGVKWLDVRGDVVTEIVSQSTLSYPVCVAWPRVLLQDVGFSSNHFLDQGQQYLLQALYVGLYVESEAMREDKRNNNVTIACDHFKYHDVAVTDLFRESMPLPSDSATH